MKNKFKKSLKSISIYYFISFFILILTFNFFCKNDYCIQFEIIQSPVDLNLSVNDTVNTLQFYSANIEGDFKGYMLFIKDNKSDLEDSAESGESCEGTDLYKPASEGIKCLCNSNCRSDISDNPTSKRKIVLSSETNSSAVCTLEVPAIWQSGSFVALKAYVEDAAGDKRYSRYSNIIEIE